MSFAQSVHCVLPECLLVAVACFQFLVGPFLVTEGRPAPRNVGRIWAVLSVAAILAAASLGLLYPAPEDSSVMGIVRSSAFLGFFRGLTLLVGLVLVLINWDEITDNSAAEFHGVLLLILAGIGFAAAANDLIVLFLALELVSIPTYVFLYLPRRERQSPEATTKYFLLSIFSSAIMLYGFSFLYGAVGTTHLEAIHRALAHFPGNQTPVILLIAAACIVAGLSFRITAVPFHFYAPDVFQGSHAGAGAMLAFLPKVVGFIALLRIVQTEASLSYADSAAHNLRLWCAALFWLTAVASMILGNVLALWQRNIKRLLAYSSISHAGYMLVGLAVTQHPTAIAGVAALLFYLVAYGATIAGVFGLLIYLRRGNRPIEEIDDLAGLSQTHPAAAGLMTILLFSLTGLPPTAGFLGKLNLLMAAWSQGTNSSYVLAIVLAINAAIAATYYLRIVTIMYLQPSAGAVETTRQVPALVGIVLCVMVTVGLFFFPGYLWNLVDSLAV
jgi:NADH-quinone oxidoreductase subunit N